MNIQDDTPINGVNQTAEATASDSQKPESLQIRNVETSLESKLQEPEVSSPKTPSSIYGQNVIAGCLNCPIKAFSLCYWDNILGPRIAHVWRTRPDYEVTRTLLTRIAVQTLNGEIGRSPTDPHIDTKYFSMPEYGVIVSSYVFGAANRGDLGVHSLSMLIPKEQRTSLINELCAPWIKRLVGKLKIFIEKECNDTAMQLFSTQLYYMAQMLQSLKENGLPRYIPMCDTLFHWEHRGERAMICKAVTAHLLTGGRSLVVGPSASQVNLMISTLALFLPERERVCSRYVSEDKPLPYHPELPVQGLLHNSSGHLPSSLRDIYLGTLPTALIDLSTRQARISSFIHKHYHARHLAIRDDLQALWRGGPSDNYPTSDMFHVPDDPETLVTDFLDDMELLPPNEGLREHFVDSFVRLLEKRAYALIAHVRHETESGRADSIIKRRKLRSDLGLTVPGDFKLVLAAAEKLAPGVYGLVYADRVQEYVAAAEDGVSTASGTGATTYTVFS